MLQISGKTQRLAAKRNKSADLQRFHEVCKSASCFFQSWGLISEERIKRLVDCAYSCAFFWKINPLEFMANHTVDELIEMSSQAKRIADEIKNNRR